MKKSMQFFKDSFEKARNELIAMYYELFIVRTSKIQREWLHYIIELDKKLSKALKTSVKASLLDLQKHIKGDQSNMGQIFKINTILDSKEEQN